jgi:hypothetical protein
MLRPYGSFRHRGGQDKTGQLVFPSFFPLSRVGVVRVGEGDRGGEGPAERRPTPPPPYGQNGIASVTPGSTGTNLLVVLLPAELVVVSVTA